MGVWPSGKFSPQEIISIHSPESIGYHLEGIGNTMASFNGSAAWPTTSAACFFPFFLATRVTVTQMLIANGTTVAGNVDAGIYDETGNLIVHSSSTAQASSGTVQGLNIVDTDIGPGKYFMALAVDNTTATIRRVIPTGTDIRSWGGNWAALTYPLPATIAFNSTADIAYVPQFGLSMRVLV